MGAVRNKDGIWVNTEPFREAATHFRKYGYYCADPWGSPAWMEYWQEQLRRILYGYESSGVKITGDHYFYLNFCPIQLTEKTESRRAKKITDFPYFWDGDYEFFWARQIAREGIIDSLVPSDKLSMYNKFTEEQRNKRKLMLLESLHLNSKIDEGSLDGGLNMIIGKSRRKGYSYKNAAIGVKNYITLPDKLTIYGAYEKKYLYPKGTMSMALSYINFVNDNTAWNMPSDYINKMDHRKASYKEYKNGVELEKGFKSEIMALTFKDNPDAARGKDAVDIFFEEAGAFGTPELLKQSYAASEDCVKDGDIKTGMITIFGCVCAGTKVWDNAGRLVNIEDITKETGIIGYGGTGTTMEPIPYLQPPAEKECVRITVNKGFSIECSTDHPLLWSKNHWIKDSTGHKKVTFKRAENINVGEQLMRVRQVPKFGIKQMLYPRLTGLLIGDGYYGGNATTQLCIADEGIFEYLNSLGIDYTVYKSSNELFYKYIGLKNFQPNLRLLGLQGQTKQDKRLPDNIWEYNCSSICELLGGYFDADGSINYNSKKNSYKITLTSTVKELLDEVEIQLYKLGIRCKIFKRYHKKGALLKSKINGYTSVMNTDFSYSLEIHSITDVIEFKKHIYFTDLRKQAVLDTVDINRKGRDKYDNCIFIESQDVPNIYFDNKNIPFNNLETCYVTSIEKLGKKPIYNLNAGLSHTYITNGFISKNTSGDMEGGTADYAHMFFHPEKYDLLTFENVFEEDEFGGQKIGFFHPVHWNMPGHMDEQGNSNTRSAIESVLKDREYLEQKGATSTDLQRKAQEKPLKPSEAFAYTNINIFPKKELEMRKNFLIANDFGKLKAQPVVLFRDPDTNKVRSEPDLKNKLEPITTFAYDGISKEGAVVIYEQPVHNAPRGLYKIGYDPVRQDNGTSLAAIIVYKGFMQGSYTKNCIVAEYIGRRGEPEDVHVIAELLAEYYNTKVMYENEVPDVKTYFQRRRLLNLLEVQPDSVISKNVKKSKVSRVYGCHMTPQLKDAGERYIKQWLVEVVDFDENNNPITNLDRINSLRLVEELLMYNKTGNFDLISALIMCMFQVQEEVLNKEYKSENENRNAKKLLEMMSDMYKK